MIISSNLVTRGMWMDSPKKEIRILKKVKKDEHEQCRIHGRMPIYFIIKVTQRQWVEFLKIYV